MEGVLLKQPGTVSLPTVNKAVCFTACSQQLLRLPSALDSPKNCHFDCAVVIDGCIQLPVSKPYAGDRSNEEVVLVDGQLSNQLLK